MSGVFEYRSCLFRESPALAIAVCAITILVQRNTLLLALGASVLLLLLYFYRVPPRGRSKASMRTIVSPCDGEIVEIAPTSSGATRIVVYLSPLDVHLQWYPTHGVVVDKKYVPGEFNLAKVLRKSDHNERTITVLRALQGWVRVDQIAGQLARRIVNRAEIGDVVRRGEEMGMIKLSSRVDVHLPTRTTRIDAKVGDRVVGGQTAIAQWRRRSPSSSSRGGRTPPGALGRLGGGVVHDGGGGGRARSTPSAPEEPHARISVKDASARGVRRRSHARRYKKHQQQQHKDSYNDPTV